MWGDPFQLLIFDVDGTIVDSVQQHQIAFLKALDVFGFEDVDSRWDHYPEHTDSAILAEIFRLHAGRDIHDPERAAFGERMLASFDALCAESPLQLMPGARATLARAQAADVVISLATGGLQDVTQRKLEFLADVLIPATVATASDAETRAEILALAVRRTVQARGVAPTAIAYVGDGPWDARAARDLGVRFAGVGASFDRFRGACDESDFLGSLDFRSLRRCLAVPG